MATDIWQGHETTMKIATSVTITTAAALDTFFSAGTDMTGILKDFTIKKPTYDPSKVDLAGKDTNSVPNSALATGTATMGEIDGTLVLPKTTLIDSILYGTGVSIGGTHTRFNPAKVPACTMAILVNLEDSSGKEFNTVLSNLVLSTDDCKLTGPDGHYEWPISAKCLPSSFYGPEYKD